MNLQSTKHIKIEAEIKSDNFCYCKVGRAMTKWGAIEKNRNIRKLLFL